MTIEFSMTIEPFVVLLLVCAMVGIYAIKKYTDWIRR